jgi:hypothetical protein
MAHLRAAIGAVGENGVVVVEEGELYGLQFYLNGKMERVSEAGLDARLERMAVGPAGEIVLVTRPERPIALTAACESDSYRCRENDASIPGFTIWRVTRIGP